MHSQHNAMVYTDEEISLKDLFNLIWQQKYLILTITLLCVFMSAIYLVIVQPVYEAKAYFIPPSISNIQVINIGRSNEKDAPLKPWSVKKIYSYFTTALLSESLKKDFFYKVYLPSLTTKQKNNSHIHQLYNGYLKTITVKEDPNAVGVKYILAVHSNSELNATKFINDYIRSASKKATHSMLSTINTENKSLAQLIQHKIDSSRAIANQLKKDRLTHLKEAVVISTAGKIEMQAISDSSLLDSVPMLYMRGSKALNAEINALKARANNDPFVPNLRQLEAEYALYNNLVIPTESFKMYRLDGPVETEEDPISPKKTLVLMLGLLGGFMLGGFVALVRGSFITKSSS